MNFRASSSLLRWVRRTKRQRHSLSFAELFTGTGVYHDVIPTAPLQAAPKSPGLSTLVLLSRGKRIFGWYMHAPVHDGDTL